MLEVSKPNNKHTKRRIGQRLSGNCAFKEIERISICDSGASDHVEVANHNDSRGAPNAISWWHNVICVVYKPRVRAHGCARLTQSCLHKQFIINTIESLLTHTSRWMASAMGYGSNFV